MNPKFREYYEAFNEEIEKLRDFELPKVNDWNIDWDKVNSSLNTNLQKFEWNKIDLLIELNKQKDTPAVYYFESTGNNECEDIFNLYRKIKDESSLIRRKQGITHTGYRNICHVPDHIRDKQSSILYVGSVKKDLFGRLISHLGFGAGRTGALHLKFIEPLPDITFKYYLLDKKYANITEHIESVMYDALHPLLGKRGIKDFD